MKNRTTTFTLLAVALLAMSPGITQAQTSLTLSLDLFYTDDSGDNTPDATSNGTWQLYALADAASEGVAGVDVSITGITGAFGNEFMANTSLTSGTPFKLDFDSGATPYDVDQDSNPATLDMIFAQVPVEGPGPQDLVYGAGVAGGASPNTDELGVVIDTSGTGMTDAILLAFGTFGAGSTPAIDMTPIVTGANIFTAQGTATSPPALGTIVAASPFTAQTRTNLTALKGDVTLDGTFVDALDFGVFATNFDSGISTDNLWQEGDLNGDKRIDAADAGEMFSSWTGDHPPAAPGSATAHYDPTTGEIEIDVNGVVNWYIEEVGGAVMTGDAPAGLLPANGLITDNDVRVGQSGFAPMSYLDHSLGNVAASGIPQSGNLRIFWNSSLGAIFSGLKSSTFQNQPPSP